MPYIGKTPTAVPLTSDDITDGIVSNSKLAQDVISSETALTSEPADTDEFLVSDAGTLKRIDYSLIKGGGITMADQWRLSTDDLIDSSETDLDSNWERVDSTGFGTIGSAMTQSSGVFTFPTTGIYYIFFQIWGYAGSGTDYLRAMIKHHDGSSTQTKMADGRSYMPSSHYAIATANLLFDCTSTSTDKIVFYGGGNVNGNTIQGATDNNRTYATFIRLGDT